MHDVFSAILYIFLFAALYAQVFLLITLFGMRDRVQKSAVGNMTDLWKGRRNTFPSVTVIVPAFNEEATIAATLRSLLVLEYAEEKLHILVVDDGSTDKTVAEVDPFLSDGRVTLLKREVNGGKYAALNTGLLVTNTELVACLDADSFAAPDSVRLLAAAFGNPDVMAATSTILVYHPRTILERVQSAEYVVASLLRHILGDLNALFVTPGPLSVYRRDVFRRIGGFSEGHRTEDLEMALRMQAHHMRIAHIPASSVETVAPNTIGGLMRQRVRWHYGFLANARDYRRLFFRPSYGHVGMIALPAAVFSIGASLAFAASTLADVASRAWDTIIEISVVGIRLVAPTLDLFFIESDPKRLLLLSTVALFLTVVIAAVELIRGRRDHVRNTFWFFLIYGFIAPVWYARALGLLLFSRNARWE